MKTSLPWGGILPAFAMAVLVLFVFSTMQYYGPDSAVLRFHEAINNDDPEELDQSIYKPVPAEVVEGVRAQVAPLLHAGAHIQIRDRERVPGVVYVSVRYIIPNEYPATAVYVARSTPNGWKVDVLQTLRQYRNPIGLNTPQ